MRIGREQLPVAVVDRFAPDPAVLRDLAATRDYAPASSLYPGLRAPVPPAYFESVGPALRHVMADILGIRGAARVTAAYFALATTPPADLTLPQRVPHIDSFRSNQFAFVHYLFDTPQGGTAFYRHRATGFEQVDAARHPLFMQALEGEFARDGEPAPAYIDDSTAQFEQTARVDARFNRAILYRGNMLHCAALGEGCDFSPDPLTGRLTVTAFMDVD